MIPGLRLTDFALFENANSTHRWTGCECWSLIWVPDAWREAMAFWSLLLDLLV